MLYPDGSSWPQSVDCHRQFRFEVSWWLPLIKSTRTTVFLRRTVLMVCFSLVINSALRHSEQSFDNNSVLPAWCRIALQQIGKRPDYICLPDRKLHTLPSLTCCRWLAKTDFCALFERHDETGKRQPFSAFSHLFNISVSCWSLLGTVIWSLQQAASLTKQFPRVCK